MPSEITRFQKDLIESVKQMRRGQVARVTKVKRPAAAEASEPGASATREYHHVMHRGSDR
jgi:hypothetical protein